MGFVEDQGAKLRFRQRGLRPQPNLRNHANTRRWVAGGARAVYRPPLAAPLFGAIHPEAYQLVPVLRALEIPRVALMLADA